MARTKNRWVLRLLKKGMIKEGGTLTILGRLDEQPDRVIEVQIPISSVRALTEAMLKEAFPPPPKTPVGAGNGGRHYSEEEAF